MERGWHDGKGPTSDSFPSPNQTQMKQVAAKPGVLDVLQLENLPRQLERQEALLGKVQRALGTYLKRQRAAFPRFHFVGDEDLLEVCDWGFSSPFSSVCRFASFFRGSLLLTRWDGDS